MPMMLRLLATTAVALIAGAATAQTEIRFTHAMTAGGNADAINAIVAAFEAAHPDIKDCLINAFGCAESAVCGSSRRSQLALSSGFPAWELF